MGIKEKFEREPFSAHTLISWDSDEEKSNQIPLNLEHMYLPIAFLLSGFLTSLIVFFVEQIMNKFTNRTSKIRA